jgi:formate/nitrite transporter FocA (FNT family)
MKSILAGAFIGLGCCYILSIPDKLIGALCFSLGLLGIRIFQLDLYTGKTQFFLRKDSPINLIDLCFIFFGNMLGVGLVHSLSYLSLPISSAAAELGAIKNQIAFFPLLINSILCGALMTIATYKETPLWISSLAVVAFISAGFNHSIADAFYLFSVNGIVPRLKILLIAVGNLIGGRLAVFSLDRRT